MRSTLLMFVALLTAPTHLMAQQTVTTRDIVELSKAGLGEEVLLALIEVHRPVFPVDTVTLKNLKDAGVAANVIVAMIRSGRELPPVAVNVEEATPAPAAAPQVVYVESAQHEHSPPRVHYEERVREVAVPVYVSVPSHYARPIVHPEPTPAEPVYWGFGGKRRPDTWKEAADVQKDAKVPRHPQRK